MGSSDYAEFSPKYNAPADKYVCAKCFDDYAICDFIKHNAVSNNCDYCNAKSKDEKIAASMDDVVELIYDTIKSEYRDPYGFLMHDDEEDQYFGNVIDTHELIWEVDLEIENVDLEDDIVSSCDITQWVREDYFDGSEDEQLKDAWEVFSNDIKHINRYTFLHPSLEAPEIFSINLSPIEMLDTLSKIVKENNLINTLDKGMSIYRARVSSVDDISIFDSALKLGPPPADKALAGRMNAAGIPVFYGAFDTKTAIRETYIPEMNTKKATVGEFLLLKNIKVLDLTAIPKTPSFFDEENRHSRYVLEFLHSFVSDISRPILKDGKEHVEYVPTQVFAEFLRYYITTLDDRSLHGILYPSSKDSNKKCCVLFFTREQCCDDRISDITKDDVLNPWRLKSKQEIEENLYLKLYDYNKYYVEAGTPKITSLE